MVERVDAEVEIRALAEEFTQADRPFVRRLVEDDIHQARARVEEFERVYGGLVEQFWEQNWPRFIEAVCCLLFVLFGLGVVISA